MKNHVFVRPAKPEDRELFIKWTMSNLARNAAEPEILAYPTTFVLCAYDSSGPLAFLPVQQPLLLDSLAFHPDADSGRVAIALRELVKACVTQAHLKGSGEIYFISDEASIQRFAQHQIFTQMPVNVYRVKLSDLEGQSCTSTLS
jgi:hypothetical protein